MNLPRLVTEASLERADRERVRRLCVENETRWRTDDLRRLVLAGLRAEGVDPKQYRVSIGPGKTPGSCSGWAYTNRARLHVCVPSPRLTGSLVMPAAVRDDFALVLVHEITHTRGVKHDDMHGCCKRRHHGGTNDVDVGWAAGLQVRAAAAEVARCAPAPERRARRKAERVAGLQDQLARWQRKAKLAATKIRKLKARLARAQRAERKALAAGIAGHEFGIAAIEGRGA